MIKVMVYVVLSVLSMAEATCQLGPRKNPALAVYAGAFDFRRERPVFALGIGYVDGILPRLDFATNIFGTFLLHPTRQPALATAEKVLVEMDVTVRWKLNDDRCKILPYLSSGVGASVYGRDVNAFAPAGCGIQARIGRSSFFFVEGQYRSPLTRGESGHFLFFAGVSSSLRFRQKKPNVNVKTLNKLAAPIENDKDKDGILDGVDSCPTVFGLSRYYGCPAIDTDGDGIDDYNDKCAKLPGVARYEGCPIPDSDGDGKNDSEDECPFIAGPSTGSGCPNSIDLEKNFQIQLDSLAKFIFFETGQAVLKPYSKVVLEGLAVFMNEHAELVLTVEGHTDNRGKPEANLLLSDARALAVKRYLIYRGIAMTRLSSIGFGETKPVASNDSVAGRAANRRVELRAGIN